MRVRIPSVTPNYFLPEPPYLTRRTLLESALVFALATAFFRWKVAQWGGFLDFDGHYHLKVAQWIAHSGLWADIRWLPMTVLGERGPDHHWLWHVMLVPLTLIRDPGEALAWGAALNGGVTAAVICAVLRMLRVPAAPLFTLLAMTAGAEMPYRMMMLRAQNAAVAYMALSLWAMATRRHKTLAVLAFLFLESYHAAVILAPMALIGCASRSALERRLVLAPLLAVGSGLVLALLASPWFPRNVEYLMFHTLFKPAAPILDGQLSSLIGTEWYPPAASQMAIDAWPAHAMLVAGAALLAWRRARPSAETLTAFGVTLLTLGMYAFAARFAEYYIPFAVIAAALAVRDSAVALRARHLGLLLLWAAPASSVGIAGASPRAVMQADHLQEVGHYLSQHGQGGEMVFNSSWSDFMALVWWADAQRYVNGLDGHYLAYGDPARFAFWIATVAGKTEDPVRLIELGFSARYVVVARQHSALARQLIDSPRVLLRVDSPEAWLFEIISPKVVPSPAEKRIPQAR